MALRTKHKTKQNKQKMPLTSTVIDLFLGANIFPDYCHDFLGYPS